MKETPPEGKQLVRVIESDGSFWQTEIDAPENRRNELRDLLKKTKK